MLFACRLQSFPLQDRIDGLPESLSAASCTSGMSMDTAAGIDDTVDSIISHQQWHKTRVDACRWNGEAALQRAVYRQFFAERKGRCFLQRNTAVRRRKQGEVSSCIADQFPECERCSETIESGRSESAAESRMCHERQSNFIIFSQFLQYIEPICMNVEQ